MQLLFKNEAKMNEEEKTKLELMRSLCVIFHKTNLVDERYHYDLSGNSKKFIEASLLMERFDVKLKDKNLLKSCHPNKLTTFPGEKEFENLYSPKLNMNKQNEFIDNTTLLFNNMDSLSQKEKKIKNKK